MSNRSKPGSRFDAETRTGPPDSQPRQALRDIVDHVEEIVRTEYPGTMTPSASDIRSKLNATMKTLKMMIIAGARPNFMKIAPLMKAIGDYNSHNGNGMPRNRSAAFAHGPALR